MKKRFLSLALALVMLLSLAPVSRAAKGPKQLSKPLGLGWHYFSPKMYGYEDCFRDCWCASFSGDYENNYSLKIYKKTETEDVLIRSFEGSFNEIANYRATNWMTGHFFAQLAEEAEEGDQYYFTAMALGDGVNTLDSDTVVSPAKTYHFASTPTTSNPRWIDKKEIITNKNNYENIVKNWDLVWDTYNEDNEYSLSFYKKGRESDEFICPANYGGRFCSTTGELQYYTSFVNGPFSDCQYFGIEFSSGQYYYILRTGGDEEKEILDSKGVKSLLKNHVQPEKLETPKNLRWENDGTASYYNKVACWDAVEGAEYYCVFLETGYEDNYTDRSGYTYCYPISPTLSPKTMDHIMNYQFGEGYCHYTVKAISPDPEVFATSDWSKNSPIYKTPGAEINEALMNMAWHTHPTKAEANAAIQQLDKNIFMAAMWGECWEDEGVGVSGFLQNIERQIGVVVDIEAKEGVELDTTNMTLAGAALNAAEDAEKVTFTVSKPEKEAVIPGAYKNTVQFDFKLDGGKAPEGQLDVPIKIFMPIPDGIPQNKFDILHYGADGRLLEIITPYTHGKTASFVVDQLGTFAFAEASAATIGDKSYDTLAEAIEAAKSGDTIVLQKDYDGEKITVSGKSLTINCGKFALDASKIAAGNNVTKKVTGTSGVDQVITLTYSAGSIGGGSTGGGGGGGGSIGGSVAPKPEDKKPEETVKKASEVFSDVESGSWYESAVTFALEKGLFKGVDENHFAPAATTTRAMIMTVLARLDGQKADTYDEAVKWATDKGVSDGSDINTIITREQFVTMLYRYAGQPQTKGQLTGFADVDDMSDWASHAMTWAAENGVIKGNEKSELSPLSGATRAEAATMIQRYIELIEK